MTMAEKLRIHREIEQSDRERLKRWSEERRKDGDDQLPDHQ